MTAIDIGPGATNLTSSDSGYTNISIENWAEQGGSLDSVEIWMYHEATSGVKVGTFYGKVDYYTPRDYESIGAVSEGSKQTFSGLDITVKNGDFLGIYPGNGSIEYGSGAGACAYKTGDCFGSCGATDEDSDEGPAIYASGSGSESVSKIDCGPGTSDLSTSESNFTEIVNDNPANAAGTLDSVEIWMATSATSGVKVGTFAYDGNNYFSLNDYESIGAVSAGSKQTFSGLEIDVSINDYLGEYPGNGDIEYAGSGGSGQFYLEDDQFSSGSKWYHSDTDTEVAIYATGSMPGWANIKTVIGISSDLLAKINGIEVDKIKTINGIEV